jgi:hypothetical protein
VGRDGKGEGSLIPAAKVSLADGNLVAESFTPLPARLLTVRAAR